MREDLPRREGARPGERGDEEEGGEDVQRRVGQRHRRERGHPGDDGEVPGEHGEGRVREGGHQRGGAGRRSLACREDEGEADPAGRMAQRACRAAFTAARAEQRPVV